MNLPTIEDIAIQIGIPDLNSWKGNCFSIASLIVKEKIVKGIPVYGHYLGEISETSFFSCRRKLGFCNHGWIKTRDSQIIDPTRWVFEDSSPYVAVFKKNNLKFNDYDEGGNKLRELFLSPPPLPDLDEKSFDLPSDVDLICLISSLLGRPFGEPVYFGQLIWMANLPPQMLKSYAKKMYKWIEGLGQSCLIPLDNRKMVLKS